jgi:D-cysteine desulfhydrase
MAGMMDLIRKGYFDGTRNILFLHTGGSPALYVYTKEFFAD